MNWTDEKNARRCNLIDKEIDETISDEEQTELDTLQEEMLAYRQTVAPLIRIPILKANAKPIKKYRPTVEEVTKWFIHYGCKEWTTGYSQTDEISSVLKHLEGLKNYLQSQIKDKNIDYSDLEATTNFVKIQEKMVLNLAFGKRLEIPEVHKKSKYQFNSIDE